MRSEPLTESSHSYKGRTGRGAMGSEALTDPLIATRGERVVVRSEPLTDPLIATRGERVVVPWDLNPSQILS